MPKYIEELLPGDSFKYLDKIFVLTIDFKKASRLAIDLKNGHPNWIKNNQDVEIENLYTLDENNNISPIKQEYSGATIKNTNIS